MPVAPKSTGLLLDQGPNSTAASVYSASTPVSLQLPEGGVCGELIKILVVGVVPTGSSEHPEIIIKGPNNTEALHVKIVVEEEVVFRWAMLVDEVPMVLSGQEGEGTTIDYDEPFVIRYEQPISTYLILIIDSCLSLRCDEDGWELVVNTEQPYPHFLHVIDHTQLVQVDILGDVSVSYAGVVEAGKDCSVLNSIVYILHISTGLIPSTLFPVSYNLTYVCPKDEVFDHDWFATPVVLLTCQVKQSKGY